ncbi:MAG: hypothetical protein IKX48_04045 [Victivallales bacterium]|nr:hypothetical protein [Victivallales bacterium]
MITASSAAKSFFVFIVNSSFRDCLYLYYIIIFADCQSGLFRRKQSLVVDRNFSAYKCIATQFHCIKPSPLGRGLPVAIFAAKPQKRTPSVAFGDSSPKGGAESEVASLRKAFYSAFIIPDSALKKAPKGFLLIHK